MNNDRIRSEAPDRDLKISYTGVSRLKIRDAAQDFDLPAAIPCWFDELGDEIDALLDTGATYSVMPIKIAEILNLSPNEGKTIKIFHGRTPYEGALHKYPVSIPALSGKDLLAEPTWFVSEDWKGPLVLGWANFLESMSAFGCKPGSSWESEAEFYFLASDTEATQS